MIRQYLRNWTSVRFIRLALSILILVQGIMAHDILLLAGGLFFLTTALLNIGCCGMGGCIPHYSNQKHSEKEIEFQELDGNK